MPLAVVRWKAANADTADAASTDAGTRAANGSRRTSQAATPSTANDTDRTPLLPPELLSLKDRYREQWAKLEAQRRKLARQLGQSPEPEAPTPPKPEVFHVHVDHLGTPREITDTHGHLAWTANYAAWGKAITSNPPRRILTRQGNTVAEVIEEQAEPLECNLRFQGQYADGESGLHYNRFRYYDTDVGRFSTQDPIEQLGGKNLYSFAPNPVQWIDPLGLSCWGDLLIKAGIPKPDGMENPHGHHIIFKGDFNHLPRMKAALERSRSIVEQYGVDPVNEVGALMWPHNRAHSIENARLVADKLEDADRNLRAQGIDPKSDCGKLAMFKELQRIGAEVFLKQITPGSPFSRNTKDPKWTGTC